MIMSIKSHLKLIISQKSLIILLSVILFFTGTLLHTKSAKQKLLLDKYNLQQAKINNYLSSLTLKSEIQQETIFYSLTDKLFQNENLAIVYFFPQSACMHCIQTNIDQLLEAANDNKNFNLIIATEVNNEKYMRTLEKIHSWKKTISFCYLTSSINKIGIFIYANGNRISNIFYPDISSPESTVEYLRYISNNHF